MFGWKMKAALAGALAMLLFGGDAVAGCSGKAWKLSLKGGSLENTITSSGARRGSVSSGGRASIGKVAGRSAISVQASRSKKNRIFFDLAPFGENSAQEACLSMDYYVAKNSANYSRKTLAGIYIGSNRSNSGGVTPNKQQGVSLRVLDNGIYGLSLYSYHLNRGSKYGKSLGKRVKVKLGGWTNITLKVKMNSRGAKNGSVTLLVGGKVAAKVGGLDLGASRGWAISGIKGSDQVNSFSGGGSIQFGYSNIVFAASGVGKVKGSFTASSVGGGKSVNKAFGLVTPSTTTSTIGAIEFASASGATKYGVRVVGKGDKKTYMGKTLPAYSAGCTKARQLCVVPYSGKSLRAGSYMLKLVAYKGNRKLSQKTYTINVTKGGASSGRLTSTTGSGGGSVNLTSPRGRTTDNTPLAVWQGDRSKSYLLKVVQISPKRTVFSRKLSASAAACASGSKCKFNLPNIRNGKYYVMVRSADRRGAPYSKQSVEIR